MPISPLPPIYFAAPTTPAASADLSEVDEYGNPAQTAPELQAGDRFDVLWYSQAGEYILVHWRWYQEGVEPIRPSGNSSPGTEGESLYRGEALLAWDWYELSLGIVDPIQEKIAQKSPDPRARINQKLGNYGLSAEAATKLRNPAYRMSFQ
jgi:hypothetical protein